MRTVIAKLPIAAACTVCLALLGTVADVARAQTPRTQPGGTTPGMTTPGTTTPGTTTPGTTTPGTPSPGTQPGGTTPGTTPGTPTPGTTTPGTGTTPGGTSPGTPPGGTTTPGTGTTGPGQAPSQAAADPFLALLEAFFDAVHQFVVDEFPDASPEFQDWLTGALMNDLFGDMIFQHFFGASSGFGSGGP